MAMRALHFDHAAIPIGDPAATYAFYAETLGLALVDVFSGKDWGGKDWLMQIFGLGDDRQLAFIALRGLKPRRQRGLPPDALHYAFSVDSARALDAWRARLTRAGVAFWEETHGERASLYFEDPNAIILEITSPPSASEPPFARDPKAMIRRWIKAGAAP
jgi:catechol 2,3-dioxygenase-like lactoylglutathione lyase family enzyme